VPNDRRDLRRRLFALASTQGGYFRAAQAKDVGYTYPAQAHHASTGNWVRVDRGLFRLGEWVPGLHDHLARWSLWSKDRAVVSHETALGVHDIGEFESAKIHLTVPLGFTMRDDAVVIHLAELPPSDTIEMAGYRVTSVIRSLIDVAANATDEEQLARAIQDAQRKSLVTPRSLRARSEVADHRAALMIERALGLVGAP
jgi:predicted transcriptional regulator of viral defense system